MKESAVSPDLKQGRQSESLKISGANQKKQMEGEYHKRINNLKLQSNEETTGEWSKRLPTQNKWYLCK